MLGNLTTMAWWDNLWLNEGFATFVGTMAVNELFPEWDMFTQVQVGHGVLGALPPLLPCDAPLPSLSLPRSHRRSTPFAIVVSS